jgi:hypothetical protein
MHSISLVEKEKKTHKDQHQLRIFWNDPSSTTHHFGVPSSKSIERRPSDTGHLIVISKTTPHDSTEPILFHHAPLPRTKCEFSFCVRSKNNNSRQETSIPSPPRLSFIGETREFFFTAMILRTQREKGFFADVTEGQQTLNESGKIMFLRSVW